MAAFDMKHDNYIINAKSTKVDDVAEEFNPLGKAGISDRERTHYEKKYKEWATGTASIMRQSQWVDAEVKTRWAKFEQDIDGIYPWSIVSDTKQVAYHENGHRLHGKFLDEINAILPPTQLGWHYLISKYGQTNPKEYFAESFALYMKGDKSQFYRIHPDVLDWLQRKDLANGPS